MAGLYGRAYPLPPKITMPPRGEGVPPCAAAPSDPPCRLPAPTSAEAIPELQRPPRPGWMLSAAIHQGRLVPHTMPAIKKKGKQQEQS